MIDYDESGDPGNPPVVFLHGIGGGSASWAPQLRALAKNYRCLAWNMPGYRDTAPLRRMDFPTLANALTEWLSTAGLTDAHVVGHSIGGMLAQELVARCPERVRSLVLSATSPAFGRSDSEFQQRFLAERLGPLDRGASMRDLAPGIVDSLLGDRPDPDSVTLARRCMTQVPDTTYRDAIACLVTFDRRVDLARIDVPCLIVAGENDTNAPPAMMQRMASRIPAARYACVRAAGHLANLEQPDQFNRLLCSFLDEVQTRSASHES